MKQRIETLIANAVEDLRADGTFTLDEVPAAPVTRARDASHGDFSSPVALSLARALESRPRDIAGVIAARIPTEGEGIERIEIAGPGFINFHMAESAFHEVVRTILAAGEAHGRGEYGAGTRVQVEFVSATPTGPLHVGHGRGAAFGASLANLLEAVGYEVQREYYVNDAGRQMDILATSVWLRYLELAGESPPFPAAGYQGDYIYDIAASVHREHGDRLSRPAATVADGLPDDAGDGGDKEIFVDRIIARARELLGTHDYRIVFDRAHDYLLEAIRSDLAGFGVEFDRWYSEASLGESGAIARAVDRLREHGHTYDADGALWFRSTDFGDDKDRVIIRANGVPTYFASDIAYHHEKFERGFDRVINVWGADHHGYISRVKGALAALGWDADRLEVPIVQMVQLYRGTEKANMSTRRGDFVTLRELRDEIGNDAARYFYVMRKCDQQFKFDLALAASKSSDNPVYYVQYAHARIHSVTRQAAERSMQVAGPLEQVELAPLTEAHERALLRTLDRYPEMLESAARDREPHQLTTYLQDLAHELHTYYNAHQFLVEDSGVREARLVLVRAVGQVLANGLRTLGVGAPDAM